MNIYPALRSRMGTFSYYVVKMSARELSENVKFASEVYEDRTLDEAIQRVLRHDRVNKEIVEYLRHQPNRFFSSLVVAALEGNPMFYPVEITDDPHFAIFHDDQRLNESFGVLKFDGTQKYYALDGQHRLSAIKTLLDRNNPISDGAPENFENDELSVIVIVPSREESDFLPKYRRLFSNLNRYAKPTDAATNIIMDEDDTFAILTRRLITEHNFFKSEGRQIESRRIKTQKGKNLKSIDPYFTSLETLYEMNIALLSSVRRTPRGWGPILDQGQDLKNFKRFRPPEDYIDALYEELEMYWNALIAEIPDLQKSPPLMRVHHIELVEGEEMTDSLLFWPIGQQLLAEFARTILDNNLPNVATPTANGVRTALKGLGRLEWRLHQAPWRYLLLVRNAKGDWAMRNEERKEAVRCGRRIQQWIIGLEELDESGADELKRLWSSMLIPQPRGEDRDKLWKRVEDLKLSVSG